MTSLLPSTRLISHLILRPTLSHPSPTLFRQISTSLILSNKASKSRIQRSTPRSSADKDRLRGTGVGASEKVYGKRENVVGKSTMGGNGLFEESPESFGGAEGGEKVVERGEESVEGLRGTGVGASKELYPEKGEVNARDEVDHEPSSSQGTPSTASPTPPTLKSTSASPPASFLEHHQRHLQSLQSPNQSHETEGETIYTANAPFNVPLVLTTAFVFAVFALSGADMARTSYSSYNSEKDEYELAPRWKRYTFATGFLCVALATITWGSLLPARIVTKLSLLRPLPLSSSSTTSAFPKGSKLVIHTPITRLPGLSPRVVDLEGVRLLGPLSDAPRPWHPRESSLSYKPKKKASKGFLSSFFPSTTSSSRPTAFKSSWDAPVRSHVPIAVQGDRASYSLMRKRNTSGLEGDNESGAWCKDWEGLEKALLGV